MIPHFSYPFVSRLVPLPPDLAAMALDFALAHPDEAGPLSLDGPVGRPDNRESGNRGYQALRRAPGRLFPGRRRGRGVAVILELLPWSAGKSELALVPALPPRFGLGDRRERAYLQAADAALVIVAGRVLALEPLPASEPAPRLLPEGAWSH